VAKWYVLPKNCMIKQTGLPDCYPLIPSQTPYDLSFPKKEVETPTAPTCWRQCRLLCRDL